MVIAVPVWSRRVWCAQYAVDEKDDDILVAFSGYDDIHPAFDVRRALKLRFIGLKI
jgi:hypothetical protein